MSRSNARTAPHCLFEPHRGAGACVAWVIAFMPLTAGAAEDKRSTAELIEALASPNAEPFIRSNGRGHTITYPTGYDKATQQRVVDAWDLLLARGTDAFSEVIEHLDNRRYSYTVGAQDYWQNLNVGDVCRRIIRVQVEVYRDFVYKYPTPPHHVPNSRKEMRDWWEKRKGWTLRELQLEGVRWAITAEHKGEFARDAQPRASVLAGLSRVADRLEGSKEPIRVNRSGYFITDKELYGPKRPE